MRKLVLVSGLFMMILFIGIAFDKDREEPKPEKPFPIQEEMSIRKAQSILEGEWIDSGATSFQTIQYKWKGKKFVVFYEKDDIGTWRVSSINEI